MFEKSGMNILCQIYGGRKNTRDFSHKRFNSRKTRDYCSSWEYVKRVIKYVDNILSEGIAKLNTPTPLGYELNNELKLI